MRQSERADRHRQAAREIGDADSDGALRFQRPRSSARRTARPTTSRRSWTTSTSGSRTSSAARTFFRARGSTRRSPERSAPSRPSTSTTGCSSERTAQALEARAGGVRRGPARAGHPARGGARLPRGARPPARRRPLRRDASPPGRRRARRSRRGAGRPGGVDARLGPALRGARDLVEARAIADSCSRRLHRRRPSLPGDLAASASFARPWTTSTRRGEGDRPRAEGGRRRPQGAPPRAHRRRARPGALGGAGRAAARGLRRDRATAS